MALALLCSKIQAQPFEAILPRVKFEAFVVDHSVREGSGVEARNVSKVLEKLGLDIPQILSVNS